MAAVEMDKKQAEHLRKAFEAKKKSEAGLNQRKLAEDLGINPSAVSRLLSGSLPISVEMALMLSRRLDCHPSLFHADFANYSEAEAFDAAEFFRIYSKLDHQDQKIVDSLINSLSRNNYNEPD